MTLRRKLYTSEWRNIGGKRGHVFFATPVKCIRLNMCRFWADIFFSGGRQTGAGLPQLRGGLKKKKHRNMWTQRKSCPLLICFFALSQSSACAFPGTSPVLSEEYHTAKHHGVLHLMDGGWTIVPADPDTTPRGLREEQWFLLRFILTGGMLGTDGWLVQIRGNKWLHLEGVKTIIDCARHCHLPKAVL